MHFAWHINALEKYISKKLHAAERKIITKIENTVLLKHKIKFIMKNIQLITELDIFCSSMYTYSL
jgi:hypothetical protein